MTNALRGLATALAVMVAVSGCKEKSDGGGATPPPPPQKKAEAPATDGPKAEAEEYAVEVSTEPGAAVGKDAPLIVKITAREGYHVNREYPLAFIPDKGLDGVKFGAARLPLGEATHTPCTAPSEDSCAVKASSSFAPERAGKLSVAGVVALSVCSKDKCLIEKPHVALAVEVAAAQ